MTHHHHSPLLAPFSDRVYRTIWIYGFISNLGSWMHETAASWLMVTLTSSPHQSSLIQVAMSLPIVLFAIPAGTWADHTDKRILLCFTQTAMAIVASALGILTFYNLVSESILLGFTALLTVGVAVTNPAWQGLVPEIVSNRMIGSAVALGGISFNLARIIGPALAGRLYPSVGAGWIFIINGISFLGYAVAVLSWKGKKVADDNERKEEIRPHAPLSSRSKSFRELMVEGLYYVRTVHLLKRVLMQIALFTLSASAMWPLLSVYVKYELHQPSEVYGFYLTLMGAGAVVGAVIVNTLSRGVKDKWLLPGGVLCVAAQNALFSHYSTGAALMVAPLLGGIGWTIIMVRSSTALLLRAAPQFRARTSSLFQMVFSGTLAIGAYGWGMLAEYFGVRIILLSSSITLIATAAMIFHLIRVGETREEEISLL